MSAPPSGPVDTVQVRNTYTSCKCLDASSIFSVIRNEITPKGEMLRSGVGGALDHTLDTGLLLNKVLGS